MIGALVVDLVAVLRKRNTVLAFLVGLMSSPTFLLGLYEVVLKTDVLDCLVSILWSHAVYALLIRPMFAKCFHIVNVLDTVDAFACWPMVAMALLDLFR